MKNEKQPRSNIFQHFVCWCPGMSTIYATTKKKKKKKILSESESESESNGI